jgi:hypothetical protein
MTRKLVLRGAAIAIFVVGAILAYIFLPPEWSRSPLLSIIVVGCFILMSPLIRNRMGHAAARAAPPNKLSIERSGFLLWCGGAILMIAFVRLFFSLAMVGQGRLGAGWIFPPTVTLIILAVGLLTFRLIIWLRNLTQNGRG